MSYSATNDPCAQLGILVVDDEPGVLSILQMILTREGFNVWLATNGEEAIDVFTRFQPQLDLVLLDLNLPDACGRQTLSKFRELGPEVVCCVMSGGLDREYEEELLAGGAARVLKKPFQMVNEARNLRKLVGMCRAAS